MALGAQGAAALTCSFHTECFEAEACAESSFEMFLSGDSAQLSTEYEDMPVLYHDVIDRSTNVFFAAGNGASYLMTIYSHTDARLSVQMTGDPVALTYIGTCKHSEDNWSG